MATTYTWAITQLYTFPESTQDPDFVVNAFFTLTGVDGQTTASIDGNTQFTYQAGEPYTPFDQLTEAQVIGWVQDALGEQGVANFEANVQGQIDSILNPPVSPTNQPLPWAPAGITTPV